MKSMGKQQLADCAGVSVRTLMRWVKPFEHELKEMGLQPNARVLPPGVVKWIADHYCIDVGE